MAPSLRACFRGSKSSSDLKRDHLSASTASQTIEASAEEHRRGPVLVELFSSQGCATSPEAEVLLSRLGRGDFALEAPVIVLTFHVDYWDHAGWKDPYGSSQWTVRQKDYIESLNLDTMFTPQVVVQGRSHCAGNEEESLLSAIMSAQRFPSPAFQATFQKPSPETLLVSLSGPLRSKIDGEGVNVMVALYESGLVMDCEGGENLGMVLANDYVVRRLEKVATVKDISAKKVVTAGAQFSLWEGFNGSKCGVAVFLQNNQHQIFGSQNFPLPDSI
ncbi:unnamed protein product [Linum tenue]|uniref:Uncharacterized protein n=1 Tax=Linum tenue TaxID=586396 RepID=A0AAV0LYT4_9ROSI|nr:unnamed protein product [Linum tenue]